MGCEQRDLDKERKQRVLDLVKEKERYLSYPNRFVESVTGRSDSFSGFMEDTCLRATMELTGGMRSEELSALTDRLTILWDDVFCRLPDGNLDKKRYQATIDSLMVCQDVRKVSCIQNELDL